ncbi:MAG TPA: tRNA threonylcarbamoyladenosine dehydratase [Epulopiscium sp.]|nr:tRNA threonylcarbamoyladenosine dehydratase [Candidatus Epulonipiscium sp.]
MLHEFSRTELLIGEAAIIKLKNSKVAIFGVGGVGSYTVEALARSGVGKIVMIDNDVVSLTNINRQLLATTETIGQAKVEAMKERIHTINPKCEVTIFEKLYLPETSEELLADDYDYIVDAVDMVTAKIDLIVKANKLGIPIISAMGAGNKMDPTRFEVADLYATSVCPLAKVMRKELRNRGITALKVVYSKEVPIKPLDSEENTDSRKQIPGSIAFVPSVSGLIIAGEVIKDIIGY